MKNSKASRRAFSILEPVIIIAILGLAAALLVPSALYIRTSARTKAIETQLLDFARKAKGHMETTGLRRASYGSLVSDGGMKPLVSFMGESYDGIEIDSGGGTLKVEIPGGSVVSVEY